MRNRGESKPKTQECITGESTSRPSRGARSLAQSSAVGGAISGFVLGIMGESTSRPSRGARLLAQSSAVGGAISGFVLGIMGESTPRPLEGRGVISGIKHKAQLTSYK